MSFVVGFVARSFGRSIGLSVGRSFSHIDIQLFCRSLSFILSVTLAGWLADW